jgi:hypothetical protein
MPELPEFENFQKSTLLITIAFLNIIFANQFPLGIQKTTCLPLVSGQHNTQWLLILKGKWLAKNCSAIH